jgi:arylsulfatase A-like enzyme
MPNAKPNVLMILTDDQGPWAMGCAGNSEIRTPSLDALANSGIRFESFFCASPVCSAARASLLTGRMPSQHGVLDWLRKGNIHVEAEGDGGDEPVEYLAGLTGYTDILAEHGYTVGLSGKWHLGDSARAQKGFSHWFVHPQTGVHYYRNAKMFREGELVDVDGYLTDAITDDALAFLETNRERPFCCEVHYTAPHSPWVGCHPQETVDSYDDCPFESCPDVPAHPWQVASAPRGVGPKRRAILQGYFAAVTEMDRNVGRLLAKLDQLSLRDNTLVFFCSDNGMNMGHHGVFGKGNGTFPQNMFEESVKVPALLSLPGQVSEGVVERGLYSHYDWLPTLLDFLGLPNPIAHELPGESFAPLLRGEAMPGRASVVVYDEYGPVRMIRDARWKYVHRYPYGPHELYDLQEDPGEEHNRIEDPACRLRAMELRAQLQDWFVRYSDPAVDGAKHPVTGNGQIGPVRNAPIGRDAFEMRHQYLDSNGSRRAACYRPPGTGVI